MINNGRIAYIDCLRGFTMLLVVWNHIADYTFGLRLNDSVLMEILISFRMPMFFFISGYIAFKELSYWTNTHIRFRIKQKARVQLIPTIIFWCAGMLTIGHSSLSQLPDRFISSFPSFWWFTLGLFVMFMCYYFSAITARFFTDRIQFPMLFILAIFLAASKDLFYEHKICQFLALPDVARNFIYFVFGLFCNKYKTKVFELLNKDIFVTSCLLTVIVLLYFLYGTSANLSHNLLAIGRMIIGIPFILIVFNLFRKQERFWFSENKISNVLKFIGRRTLDIYLLHFFFLPNLLWMNKYLVGLNQTVLQFAAIFVVTFLNVGICLTVSAILRSSKFLAHFLFGVNSTTTSTSVALDKPKN